MLLEAEPQSDGAADHNSQDQSQVDGGRVGAGANLRFHNIVLEKVFLMFVVVFAFPMLGGHFFPPTTATKGHDVPSRQEGDREEREVSVVRGARAKICVLFTGAQLLLGEDVEREMEKKKGGAERR